MSSTPRRELLAILTDLDGGSSDLEPAEAAACLELIGRLYRRLRPADGTAAQPDDVDPRLALRYAAAAQEAADESARTQIYAAHLVRASAAHTLTVEELDALRRGQADFTAEPERSAGRPSAKTPEDLLASWLHLDYFEARTRLADAALVYAQFDLNHDPHPPQFPLMAELFHDARLHPAEVLSAARRLARLEPERAEHEAPTGPTVADEQGRTMEQSIAEALREEDAATRKKDVNNRFKQAKEREGKKDPEREAGLFRRGQRHGLTRYELRVSGEDAELLDSMIDGADNPRTEAGRGARTPRPGASFFPDKPQAEHPDFVTDEEAAAATWSEPHPASVARRRLNALMSLLRINSKRLRALLNRSGAAEDIDRDEHGEVLAPTVAPQVVVTMTLQELEARAETCGTTLHGHPLSPTQLRQVLARSNIIPMVLGSRGEVLDLGRRERYHTKPMRLAVSLRDRGCIVPGCTASIDACDVHHVIFWSQGGDTSVSSGAMLCSKHHHDAHAGIMKVIADGGVPKVIRPKYIDPEQRPVRNTINLPGAA